jgi:hypothetical protein
MATDAQIAANRENAQHSTGPRTEAGKANSCRNNTRWGFRGRFEVLPSEAQEEFDRLLDSLRAEHQPQCVLEDLLILKLAQHFWLSQRAQLLQQTVLEDASLNEAERQQQLALYLRYQTTNDRGFQKCIDQLLKLRAQRVKEVIGFERQRQQAEAHAARENRQRERSEQRQAAENRKNELHHFALMLAEAKLTHQQVLNLTAERAHRQAA